MKLGSVIKEGQLQSSGSTSRPLANFHIGFEHLNCAFTPYFAFILSISLYKNELSLTVRGYFLNLILDARTPKRFDERFSP